MRVLAADDDVQVRDVLARLLARLGAEVRLARDGVEALSMLRETMGDVASRIDLAFVDLAMPWSTGEAAGRRDGGIRLARAIRAEESGRGVAPLRLVALTGADEDAAAAARSAGFDRFVQKPVSLETLKRELGPES